MMPKILFFLLGFAATCTLYASRVPKDAAHTKIEITANHLNSSKTTVTATDGVVVYYQDSVIRADRVVYNKETHLLTLDGDIEMIGYRGTKEHISHMEIHTDSREVTFKELFLVSQNDVWMFTQQAEKKEGNYTFGETVLSSCEVTDPIWKMVASRASYDSTAKYMKAYDTKIYFKDVPVFYTPYMAFSTDRERRSGLLFPFIGYRANEGLIYEQPIYWAISTNMDLELNPQIRTNRSLGMYSTFRFVDSDHSSGQIRAGYFQDSAAYQQRYHTPKRAHYGAEIQYNSTKLISDLLGGGFEDELYVNTIYLNDIEYLNLQKSTFGNFGQVPIQESRINYFLADDTYYLGLNAKYFIDTRLENNNKTIQQLPAIQLHQYLDKLIWNNLTYSIDAQLKNFDRIEGSTMKQVEMKVPFEFTTAFLDDFLNLSLGETFYYNKSFFGNAEYAHNEFQYFNNYHSAKLFSDLTKQYDTFIHVLQPSLEYILPGSEYQSPVDFDALSKEQKELFVLRPREEYYAFSLSQYFYDTHMNLKFYQRISQRYYVDRKYKFSDLSNEMQYNWNQWQFYSDITYAFEFHEIRESSTRVTLNENKYNFSLSHTFKQQLADDMMTVSANDINLNFGYRWNEKIRLYGGLTYNIDTSESKQWLFGGKYTQDCWGVNAALRQDITPRPEGEATTENSFYIQFDFKPFVSLGSASFQ
ncbi:Outer membrane protein Imp, required for envelope biogenesis / Organic solvent tolerance protein precursor [hydrothermal vent metagenome]|uniref:Outer membrane protein Imp, required for envelope biogenesis / Organic solvent tolerance protein n=1 Tax=hydrothermal vent metagenome TaxID=652676 RepID=A0A1W1BLF7_9ZZZZ